MKYHTTLSTIVISLFVLLCFSLTVLFCVFVLSVQSPGYLIADQIISHIDNSSDFSVSFSSIDRNISSRTVINGISLDYKDENILYADKITIYQGPLSLVWFFLTGAGRVETDVTGLRVTLDPLLEDGSKGSSSSMSIEDVNRLIQSVESYDAVLSQMAFYNLSYSINIEDFSLRMGSGLTFENLRMNLSLNEGLELDSFVFSAPSAGISLADAAVSADNISLSLSKDVSGYRTRFSIDRFSGWYQDISLDAENTALTLDFESFASLDLMHLPLGLSASSISLEAADWQAGAQRLSASTDAEGGDIVLIGLSLASPNLSASAPRTEINLVQTGEGYTVSFALPSGPELRLADPSVDVAAGSVSGSVSLTGVMSWDVSLTDTFVSGLDGLTKGLYSSARISNLTLSGQANDTARYIEAGIDVTGGSSADFFDGTELSGMVSLLFEEGSLSDASINVSSLQFRRLSAPVTASVIYSQQALDGYISYSDSVLLSFSSEGGRTAELAVSSLSLGEFAPLLELWAPVVSSYIDEETFLNGSLEFSYSFDNGFDSTLFGSLAVSGIRFNQYRFNFASSLSSTINDERASIDYFTITTEWLRLSYSGDINFRTQLPEGSLSLEMTGSGARLLNIDFSLDSDSEYLLNAYIPRFTNSYLRGSINWANEGMITSSGELRSGSTVYPFELVFDLNNADFQLNSAGLDVSIDFSQYLNIEISFTNFTLPTISPRSTVNSSIDGRFTYSFDLAAQSYYGRTEGFVIRSAGLIASRPDISFDLYLDNTEVRLDNILVSDSFTPLSGSAVYRIGERNFALTLGNRNERANLSLLLHSGDYSGILVLDNLSLDRFGLAGTVLNTSLTGRGESSADFSFSGTVYLTSTTESQYDYSLSADVTLTERGVDCENITYSTDELTVSGSLLSYDTQTGRMTMSAMMRLDKANRDRVYPVSAQAELEFTLEPHDTIIEAVTAVISDLDNLTVSGRIRLPYLDIDSSCYMSDRVIDISLTGPRIEFAGNLISGSADLSLGSIDVTLSGNDIVSGHIYGTVSTDNLDLHLDQINFNLGALNWLYSIPLVTFDNPSWVYGDFVIYGSLDDTHIYGQGGSHGFDMRVWWVENAYLHIGDTQVTVVDNHATTSMTPVVVVDEDNGDLHRGFAVAQAQLSNADIIDFYDVEVWVPEGETIYVRVPVYSQNFQIKGDVSGYFRIYSDLSKNYLSGDLTLYNAVFSMGMDELPHWWGASRFEVRNEYDVTLMDNCSFVLPLSEQPIVRAYANENTGFHFLYDSQTHERAFNGSLSFRSGEIYYFQKSFFITEGSIDFPSSGADMSAMRLNFRARLRSYNSDGEKVDIYLVLNNSTIDNLNPIFESSPQMSTEEIMSVLGASILPSSSYGSTGLASVASLVTSGVDVLNRMGIINTSSYADLGPVVRDSLGIDIFSVKTNILENFILNTMLSPSGFSYSPLATYLDNTSIYIGKYLTGGLYLQAMVYLQAVDPSYNDNSFLSDDLSLDIEISLEWDNPMGTFTLFTTPGNLTLHSFFDNIGIRYNNTINF